MVPCSNGSADADVNMKAVKASSLRSLHLLHNCQLTVLVYHPQPLKGTIITREPAGPKADYNLTRFSQS